MATHSSTLTWRIPWTRGAWWATVHGVKRAGHDRAMNALKDDCKDEMR